MPKKFFFAPLESGVAHITRSLAVAEELVKKGHDCYIGLPERKKYLLGKSKVKFIELAALNQEDTLEVQKVLTTVKTITPFIKSDYQAINKIKPDCVIIDMRSTALKYSLVHDKALAILTHADSLPDSCQMPNMFTGKTKKLIAPFLPLINKAINIQVKQYYRAPVTALQILEPQITLQDMIRKANYIVPELPGYARPQKQKVNYCGPIFWQGFESKAPTWLKKMKSDRPTIYLTFGGSGFKPQVLISLADKLVQAGFQVIVSSSKLDPAKFPTHPHLHVERYVPGDLVTKKADLVISHGGYGTNMQAILNKTPLYCLPTHADQYLHAWLLQEQNLAKTFAPMTPELMFHLLEGNAINQGKVSRKLDLDQVVDQVKNDLADNFSWYNHRRATAFIKARKKYSGAKKAADVLEKMV